MGPIEGLWFVLLQVFVVLGVIRGFLKELGLTTVMIVYLFAIDQILPRLEELIKRPDSPLARIGLTEATKDTPLWLIFTLVTFIVVYIAYEGETLAFEGSSPKGLQGVALGALVGFINGYLVCGTLWWFLHRYNYPIQALGLFVPYGPTSQLSPLATQIVVQMKLLPPDLLGAGAESPASLGVLPLLVVTMILLRVIR